MLYALVIFLCKLDGEEALGHVVIQSAEPEPTNDEVEASIAGYGEITDMVTVSTTPIVHVSYLYLEQQGNIGIFTLQQLKERNAKQSVY